jgi:hypothetical protein
VIRLNCHLRWWTAATVNPLSLHVVTQAFSPNVHHFPWYRGLLKTMSLVKFQSAMVRSADPISEERIIKEV